MNFVRPAYEYFSGSLNVHELFFISFSLGRVFFYSPPPPPPPHKFSNDSSLSKIRNDRNAIERWAPSRPQKHITRKSDGLLTIPRY